VKVNKDFINLIESIFIYSRHDNFSNNFLKILEINCQETGKLNNKYNKYIATLLYIFL